MISQLNHHDEKVAEQILHIQIPAYLAEADIIGFRDIPALGDTVGTIMTSNESFYGYRLGEELAGVVSCSFDRDTDTLDICRLVVHPAHFRKGIGRALISHVLEMAQPGCKVTVSTGAANEPAIALYRIFGFVETGQVEVATGVYTVNMEYNVYSKLE